MSVFQVTAYPAKQDGHFTEVVMTKKILRTEIDCKLAELPAKLAEVAHSVESPDVAHRDVYVCAYPVGRAPNGFKAMEAERKNCHTRVYVPAARYVFHADPGHGWLQVSRAELDALGIADKISPYSYQRNGFVYLEEDCDYGVFIEAKKARGEAVEITELHREVTPIRDYPSYRP